MTVLAPTQSLKTLIQWLEVFIETRLEHYFSGENGQTSLSRPDIPHLDQKELFLFDLSTRFELNWEDYLILSLAWAPHLKPQALDIFFTENPNFKRGFTEFGGIKGQKHGGFIPSLETALFLLSGDNFGRRIELMKRFRPEHPFFQQHILSPFSLDPREPLASQALLLSPHYLARFFPRHYYQEEYDIHFPAKEIQTERNWSDLILTPRQEIAFEEVKSWMQHKRQILGDWGLGKIFRPGYRILFHGPPGTGKTFAVSLLGKELGKKVWKIDLSQIVSKYIGETEKNLSRVFDIAAQQDHLLFFDEADALFGKRSHTKSSHDRYANQEVSYLLQRIEDYPGLLILASNFKGNMDEAFIRRFEALIHFPLPASRQRLQLWEQAFSFGLGIAEEIDLERIAENFELSGGEIVNVLRYCANRVAAEDRSQVRERELLEGIKREMEKGGRVVGDFS